MKKLYIIAPVVATVAFAALVYWTATPNPWRSIDYTTNRSGECGRHHVPMEKRKVRISYGGEASPADRWVFSQIPRLELASAFIRAEQKDFPNAQSLIFGGDAIPDRAPSAAYIYVCPKCAEALEAWKKEAKMKTEPNKAMQPTPVSVTPCADAQVAPLTSVANF
jgi:hypothetical protein